MKRVERRTPRQMQYHRWSSAGGQSRAPAPSATTTASISAKRKAALPNAAGMNDLTRIDPISSAPNRMDQFTSETPIDLGAQPAHVALDNVRLGIEVK